MRLFRRLCAALICAVAIANAAERVIHPNWSPRAIRLKAGGLTPIMGFRAELGGGLTHAPMPRPRPYAASDVFGFESVDDAMTWRVVAPGNAFYRVAVLYDVNEERCAGYEIQIRGSGKTLQAVPRPAKRPGGPGKLRYTRQWIGELPLKRGENLIELSLSEIPAGTTDFRVKSIELVQPEALENLRQRANRLRSDTKWMEGGYGLFTHWSPLGYPFEGEIQARDTYQQGVEAFDVQAYADMVGQTGASWVVFTTAHGYQFWPGPSRTLDRILPGRTSQRDLVMELADELGRRGIRLLLYYHHGRGDETWMEASGMFDADPQRWFDNVVALHEEMSRRYGKKIGGTGLYIDGGHNVYYQYDFPFERLVRAIKSGNPDAVVGFATDDGPWVTLFSDVTVQDSAANLNPPMPEEWFQRGGPYEGMSPQYFFFLDDWIPRKPLNGAWSFGPRHSSEVYVDYFSRMTRAGIPITVNLAITQDVKRGIPFVNPESLDIMRAVNKAVASVRSPRSAQRSVARLGSVPRRAGPYVTVYRPQPDVFPGPDTAHFRAGRIYEQWIPNDHAIHKGQDGRWHAIGITHPKPPPEARIHEGEFLSFHAASPVGRLTQVVADDLWFDMPKVLPPGQRPGEKLQHHAPYIVETAQGYWMVYGPDPIRYATSPDLIRWTPRGPLFEQEGGARDPNILLWDGTYYLTYVTGNSLVYRTSRDLATWSGKPVEIFRLPNGAPESPTLLRHDGAFYLFYTVWDGAQGPYDSRTFVHRSVGPLDFRGTRPVAQLDAHAAEIFQDESGGWWISSAEYPATGVSLAPLLWESPPGASGQIGEETN